MKHLWDCETDYEEAESPWIRFEDCRPEDKQRCLVWPQREVHTYDAKSDTFGVPTPFATPRYWMPIPDDVEFEVELPLPLEHLNIHINSEEESDDD